VPRLTVWVVRASLLHLAAGFTLGALLLAHKGIPIHPALWRLLPAHVELLLVGWTVQLAMGVAFWILPRFAGGTSRGNEALAWCAVGLVNLGVVAVVLSGAVGAAALALPGRVAEAGGTVAFALHAWGRVRGPSV
jgi:hypothetical protein